MDASGVSSTSGAQTVVLKYRFAVTVLALGAVLRRWQIAPAFALLPLDYRVKKNYEAELWSRQTPVSTARCRRGGKP